MKGWGRCLAAVLLALGAVASALATECRPEPLPGVTLYLRGSMNNWGTDEDLAFEYRCDAYYLNVSYRARHDFKIADDAWSRATSFGGSGGATIVAGAPGNLEFNFVGEHTLRLAFDANRPVLHIGPKSQPDRSASTITDTLALSLRHDSRSLAHKSPFGAVTAGTKVDFSIEGAPGIERVTLVVERRRLEGNQNLLEYTEVARRPMRRSADGRRWTVDHGFAGIGVHGYWFEAVAEGRTWIYQNNREALYWTREKGTGGVGLVSALPAQPKFIRRFRQTVYASGFTVPDWAADVVYYYVFPDRFRNGDKRNDPKPGPGIEFHKNWLDKPWRPGSADGSDDQHNNDFFGGDLAGLIEKLDYIRDLGANTIYMTPVFRATSNHKYDTADYQNIDPAFGTNADFERLTREAARRGIRVIPDTSLNHTGSDSLYFDRFGRHPTLGAFEGGTIRPDSPYASWYRFDPTQKDPDRQYQGWVGVTSLPELDKSDPSFRAFAFGDPNSVTRQWLDRGAAGWRMDVAPWVPDDFWRDWRRAVKQQRPQALTIAETWFDASKFFLGDMFDSTMNYIFRNAVLDHAAGGPAGVMMANLEAIREAYPPQAHFALMNLLSSHDAARALHRFGWHDEVQEPAAIAVAKQRLRLALLFQMTYPGAPAVYYGDEVGVTGGDDPYNRGTYPWADEGGRPDTALLADFRRLIRLRHEHAVLRRGSLAAPLHVDDQVVVQLRRLDDRWALVATSNAPQSRTLNVSLPAEAAAMPWRDALDGGQPQRAEGGRLTLTIPALYGRVLITP